MADLIQKSVLRALPIAIVALSLALGVSMAGAQSPGGSATHEYTEDVPTADGNDPSEDVGGGNGNGGQSDDENAGGGAGGSGGSNDTVPPVASGDFEAQGYDGAGAAGLADATNPDNPGGGAGGERSGQNLSSSRDAAQATPPAQTATTVTATTPSTTSDDDGAGLGLPLALGIVLLAIGGILWYRRRYPEALVDRSTNKYGALPNRLRT